MLRDEELYNHPLVAFGNPGDFGPHSAELRVSSWGTDWPPIVDAQNNPAPTAFGLRKGYPSKSATAFAYGRFTRGYDQKYLAGL
jgi:hypothetical protein